MKATVAAVINPGDPNPRKQLVLLPEVSGESFSFFLPSGTYELVLTAKEAAEKRVPFEVGKPPSTGGLDLGAVEILPGPLQEGHRPPPWKAYKAQGVDPGIVLDDFKGKWLVVAFWGYG